MRLGIFDSTAGAGGDIDTIVANAHAARSDGFAHFWLPQIFSVEALSVLAIIGREVPDIGLGTAVVPTFPRHPLTMAAEALTAQAASKGRLTLGIGLSHRVVVENMMGLSFAQPARHMEDYLNVLLPLVKANAVSVANDRYTVNAGLTVDGASPVPVLVAGLGPRMLALAGGLADGTVTWMTGPRTLAEHIVPSVRSAAKEQGRPDPQVVAALPVAVTDDPAAARERAANVFAVYRDLPSYRAMLDREGVDGPADVAIVGTAAEVGAQIRALADAGVTDFVAVEFSGGAERAATREVLKGLL